MGDVKVRINQDLYNSVKAVAEKSGRSISDVVEEAVRAYLLGTESSTESKPIKSIISKIISLHFSSRCVKCGAELPTGELAYYVRIMYNDNSVRSYVLCLDCYYKDTALATLFLKKRKLEITIRGLDKRANQLAQEIENLEKLVDIAKIKHELNTLFTTFKSCLMKPDSDYSKNFMQIIDGIYSLLDRVSRIESMITASLKTSSKREIRQKDIL